MLLPGMLHLRKRRSKWAEYPSPKYHASDDSPALIPVHPYDTFPLHPRRSPKPFRILWRPRQDLQSLHVFPHKTLYMYLFFPSHQTTRNCQIPLFPEAPQVSPLPAPCKCTPAETLLCYYVLHPVCNRWTARKAGDTSVISILPALFSNLPHTFSAASSDTSPLQTS